MPLPAQDLWVKIQKEISGKSNREQLVILQSYLSDWPDTWKGPYRDLKERLLQLHRKLETTELVKSARGRQDPFHIKRQGDGQMCLIGITNSGKSALVYTLTSAPTDVMDYPFTTQFPIVGMLDYQGASIQIIDTPPIVPDISKGEGAGGKLLHLIRTTDALGIVIDLSQDPLKQMKTILTELEVVQIRAIPQPLETVFCPKGKDGIKFSGHLISKEEQTSAHQILAEEGISHAEIIIRTQFSSDELLAQVKRKQLIPTILIANKNDVMGAEDRLTAIQKSFAEYTVIDVNFLDETNFDKLKNKILEILGLICVFLLDKPAQDSKQISLFIPRSITIREIVEKLSLSQTICLKSAKVWGKSVKRLGQDVSGDHLVEEGDLIYLRV